MFHVASLFGRSALAERARQIKTDDILDHVALVQTWLTDYETGSLKKDKETSREQDYNQDFFKTILGYRAKPHNPYTFEPKDTTEKKQYPDAVLRYTDLTDSSVNNIAAVVELKGASINLDKPQQREGNLSPVQQAFKYKPQYRSCPFVVVSNFYEFRLYNDTQLDYESWTLHQLVDPADDYLNFKKWYALLHVDNMTAPHGRSVTERLLSDIRQKQLDVGKDFYAKYSSVRTALLQDVWRKNPNTRFQFSLAIQKVQTIIDRVMFACFAEDGGLLPDDTLQRVIKDAENSSFGTLWDELKDFFTLVDRGSGKLGIPNGYNGGLFTQDPLIDALDISDGPLRRLLDLGKYDFKEDLRVNILGHVFEQSITDIEQIKRRVQNDKKPFDPQQDLDELSRRKKEGIYYTPDYIVRYIVGTALGGYLSEQELRIQKKHNLSGMRTEVGYEAREKVAYTEYQHVLQTIKVLDPACGSGAFLVHVFDYLLAENKRVDAILGGTLTSQEEFVRSILSDNIFGVDLNEESVEITKLSLWLKTASKGKKLTALDGNIKCGNSLISERSVTDSAFRWDEEFEEIVNAGGFDVVVGNPPYVDSEEMVKSTPEQRKYIAQEFNLARGNWDLLIPFTELALKMLKDHGRMGFITSNRWLAVDYGSALREAIYPGIAFMCDCTMDKVFESANVSAVVFGAHKSPVSTIEISALDGTSVVPDREYVKGKKYEDEALGANLSLIFSPDGLDIAAKIKRLPTLNDAGLFTVFGAFTTGEAYEFKPLVSEATAQAGTDYYRLINTGTIDRYLPLWGLETFSYLKDKYQYPVVSREEFEREFPRRAKRLGMPKIMMSGIRHFECVYDPGLTYLSTKSTTIVTGEPDDLGWLAAVLNSTFIRYYIAANYLSSSMNGGINFTPDLVKAIPVKVPDKKQRAWLSETTVQLQTLARSQAELSEKFRQLIRGHFKLEKWPRALSAWWLLGFDDFCAGLGVKLSITARDELSEVFEKHRAGLCDLQKSFDELDQAVDAMIARVYKLTDADLAVVNSV